MGKESGEIATSEDAKRATQEGQRADKHVERDEDADGPKESQPDPLHQRKPEVDLHCERLL